MASIASPGETISNAPSKVNGSVAYGLDPVGNRLTENSTIPSIGSGSYGYNADDQLSTESYDQNGNTISTGGKSFSYDSQNELVAMNGGAVSLAYDAFGNRVAKTASGITTRYLVDDLNPTGLPQVMDELTNGVVTRTYTYGLQRVSEDQIVNGALVPSFYGYDGLGNVRQLTNAAGAITDSYEYDAFGDKIASSGNMPNNYLYRSEQYDPDLGLYYLRARYYNPLTGRFMSRDPKDQQVFDLSGYPINPRSLHIYVYAGGDPINRIDPKGREDLIEYTGEVLHLYHSIVEPVQVGHGFGECTSDAFGAIAEDMNATLEHQPLPISPQAIAQGLRNCAGDAIADFIKGPWGLAWK